MGFKAAAQIPFKTRDGFGFFLSPFLAEGFEHFALLTCRGLCEPHGGLLHHGTRTFLAFSVAVQAIDAMEVYKEVSDATYMESVADVEKYIRALSGKLTALVESNHKVRIK